MPAGPELEEGSGSRSPPEHWRDSVQVLAEEWRRLELGWLELGLRHASVSDSLVAVEEFSKR